MNKTLIIFARKPELGKVKTRLAKITGASKALEIYTALLNRTINTSNEANVDLKIYWSELSSKIKGKLQEGNDLGERMYNALKGESNSAKVCLIGTDVPSLSKLIIDEAFEALDTCDYVFGPAKDGGYYLVGINAAPAKELFLQKRWSHNLVLTEALNTCQALKLTVKLLPVLQDVDTIDDYNEWKNSTESF